MKHLLKDGVPGRAARRDPEPARQDGLSGAAQGVVRGRAAATSCATCSRSRKARHRPYLNADAVLAQLRSRRALLAQDLGPAQPRALAPALPRPRGGVSGDARSAALSRRCRTGTTAFDESLRDRRLPARSARPSSTCCWRAATTSSRSTILRPAGATTSTPHPKLTHGRGLDRRRRRWSIGCSATSSRDVRGPHRGVLQGSGRLGQRTR